MQKIMLIRLVVLALPVLAVFVLGMINKKTPFRWANVFKVYLTFLFLGVGIGGHLVYPQFMVQLIPPFFPLRLEAVYLSGILEVAFAVLLWTRYQRPTGLVIIVYLALVIPFNIYGWTVPGNSPNFADDPYYLWIRVPMQLVFAAFAYYGTRPERSEVPKAA